MRASWWWIDRWRKSTAYTDMTLAEQGAYRNLLDELWIRKNGAIPNDERILGKIAGNPSEWPGVRAAVLARFHLTPEGWRHETHDEVAAQTEEFRKRQSEKGSKRMEALTKEQRAEMGREAARARWDASRCQPECQPSTSQSASHDASLPSPSPSPSPSPKETESPSEIPVRAKPKIGPQDEAARLLASRLGSSLNPCRKQVAALVASGWTLERVSAAIESHAEPGVAPWDWTKAARGNGAVRRDGGLTVPEILARAEKPHGSL